MTRDEVIDTVMKSDTLPTLPFVASKLLMISGKEETTISDIADLVSKDVSLSAKILKVVNSSFYSFPNKIGSIQKAVSILGTRAVRSLVLSFSLLKIKPTDKKGPFDYEKFWEKSLTEAVSAKLIKGAFKECDPEEIFIAGLLQNLGKMFLARTFPEEYTEVLAISGAEDKDLAEVETKIIGADHCLVGAAVAKSWGFPEELTSAIAYHHNPDAYKGTNREIKVTLRAVYLSGLLANIFSSDSPDAWHKTFSAEAKKMLGFDKNVVDRICKEVHSEVNAAAKFFGLDVVVERPIEDILQEANIRLSQLNMSYDQVTRELTDAKMELHKLTKDLKDKNQKLETLANMDGLTEVYNHRYFQTFLKNEINRSIRNDTHLSIILADVDDFKKVNDTYGHQVGDFILKELCQVAKAAIREYDLIARYGGEEFVFVLPETDLEEAQVVAEKIRTKIASYSFEHNHERYSVTLSLGVASMRPAVKKLGRDEFIVTADRGLMIAKKKGKNRVALQGEKSGWFA